MSTGPDQDAGGLRRYQEFFRQGSVLKLEGSSLAARLPGGMNSLVLVLVVQQASSLVAGGVAAAAYTIGTAVVGPYRGRAVDKYGARVVLLATAAGQTACMLGVLAAVLASAPVAVDIILAAVAGALLPPVNPVMRTIWSRTFDGAMRRTAFSVESVMLDVVYIIGPALAAVVAGSGSARWCLILAAVLTLGGCVFLASVPETRTWPRSARQQHWLGAWADKRLRALLPVGFFVTGSISAVEIALVAFARSHGHPADSGFLIALLSVGSVVGGLAYGALNLRFRVLRQLLIVSGALGLGYAVSALASSTVVLGLVIVATGLFLAPAITLEYAAVDEVADPDTMTEAFSLFNSVGQGGSSAGAVLAGIAGQHAHGQGAFLVAAVMAVAGALLAGIIRVPAAPAEPAVSLQPAGSVPEAPGQGHPDHAG